MLLQLVALIVLWGCVTGEEVRLITSSCPTGPSVMTFLEKREESESIGLKEVVRQATSLLPVTDNSSVPTVEAAYKAALSAVKKEDNPENAAQFYEALGEITEVVYRSCFGDMPVTLANFSSVKEQFMQALSGRQIPKLREAYGFLLCLKHLSETDSGSRKRRSTPGEIEAFFDSIDADKFGLIFFIAGDPYSVAFIIDDTGSMREEIEAAKCLVRGFLTSERAEPSKYILGTFNDPGMCSYVCILIWIITVRQANVPVTDTVKYVQCRTLDYVVDTMCMLCKYLKQGIY